VAFQVFKSKGVAFEVFKFSGVAFRVFAVIIIINILFWYPKNSSYNLWTLLIYEDSLLPAAYSREGLSHHPRRDSDP
jgi:lipoprotein signal peptidase